MCICVECFKCNISHSAHVPVLVHQIKKSNNNDSRIESLNKNFGSNSCLYDIINQSLSKNVDWNNCLSLT